MPSRPEILDQIKAIAGEALDWHGELSEESRLIEDLGLDSLRGVSLLVEIENRLRVRFTPDDEAGLVTVGDLVSAIERRRGSGA